MKGITLCIAIFLSLILAKNTAYSQGQFTTAGKEFWLAFGSNNGSSGAYLEIKFVATKATTVTIEYTAGGAGATQTLNLSAGEVKSYILTAAQKNYVNNLTTGKTSNSMRITATEDISVFALNQKSATTDATTVLPVNNYGKEYYQISYTPLSSPGDGYMIIANEAGTTVTTNGKTVKLGRGEVYSVYGMADLTGKKTIADKPVAYLVANSCVNIPIGKTACDCLYEQLVPVSSWGNNFLVGVTVQGKDRFRVLASQATTKVLINGSLVTTLNEGGFYEADVTAPLYIEADKPVAVAHYMTGQSYVGTDVGDPALAWVPPIEQNVKGATIAPFMPTSTTNLSKHYVMIVTPTPTKNNTKVNGGNLSGGSWRDHALSGYSIYSMPLNSNIPYTFANDKGIVLMGYGLGNFESYSYLAASSARKLDAAFYITNDSDRYHYQDANLLVPFDCGSPFSFEAEIQYELQAAAGHIKWYIDGVEQVSARDQLTWTQPYLSGGNHTVKLSIIDSYGDLEELETTLKVECATDMTPKTSTIYEGDTQQQTITLSGTAPTNILFTLTAHTGTTAGPTDYSFPANVTIAQGTKEVKFNVLATANSIINEPDKILVVRAYNSEYGELFATITIKDRITAAQKTLSLTASPLEINEPHTGYTTAPNSNTFTLSLPPSVITKTPIRVGLAYSGTATKDIDYQLSPASAGTYTEIPANSNKITFTMVAKEDSYYEGDETVLVTPSAPAGYTLSTGVIAIKIVDKTPSGIVVATLLDAREQPVPAVGKFQIRFSKASVTTKKPIKVVYKLVGCANDGTVYDLVSPTEAIIALDAHHVDVEIKPKNNLVVEGTREVKIELISAAEL